MLTWHVSDSSTSHYIAILFCKYIGKFKIQVHFYKELMSLLCQWPDMGQWHAIEETLKPRYQSRGHEKCAWVVKMGPCDLPLTWPSWDLTHSRHDLFDTRVSLETWKQKISQTLKAIIRNHWMRFVWFAAAGCLPGKHCISINSVWFSLSGLL